MQRIKNKKIKVTVGIPAYNEQENIGYVISDLLSQKNSTYVLEAIFVISDGSTDNSAQIVRSSKNHKVKLIEHHKREGKPRRLNELYKLTKSEILVILDADIRIGDRKFLNKLIRPIQQGKADLVSCRIQEVPGKEFFERMINFSNQFKREIFENYHNGINIFTNRGPVMALSRRLYKQLEYPEVYCDDMFTLLYNQQVGYRYYYSRDTQVFYRSPANMPDHFRQSKRFVKSDLILKKYFDKKLVDDSMRIPIGLGLRVTIANTIKHPVYMTSYLMVLAYTRLGTIMAKASGVKWQIVTSSKKLK